MSTLFNANQIAEQALRIIGAYSINDSAAEGDHVDQALVWLDLNMAELSGRRRLWWLVPQSVTIDLTSGTGDYLLDDILGELAPDGFAFPVSCFLVRNGRDLPMTIIPRRTWDAFEVKTTEGPPTQIYIDRQRETRINLYPVPNETGLQLKLTFQTFAPSVTGKDQNDHGLRLAWQRWAIYATASDIGRGPVRVVPKDERDTNSAIAREARDALLAVDNRERADGPHQIARVDY